jgi:AcrR family transcriptional regulator
MKTEQTTATLGRRERHKIATRERLFQTALDLFVRQGYDDTSIDQVAEAADVARGTVFNHFSRKEEFLIEWQDRRREIVRDVLSREQAESIDTATRLRDTMSALSDVYEADMPASLVLYRCWQRAGGQSLASGTSTADILTDTIRFGQARGDVPAHIDPVAAGHLLLDGYAGTLSRWAAGGNKPSFPLKPALLIMLELVLHGLLANDSPIRAEIVKRAPASDGKPPGNKTRKPPSRQRGDG